MVSSASVVDQANLSDGRAVSRSVVVDKDFPSTFAWDGKGYNLSDGYSGLLDLLGVESDSRKCVFGGYSEYAHPDIPGVDCPVETVYKPMLDVGRYHVQYSHKHSSRSSERALERFLYLKEVVEGRESGDFQVKHTAKLDYLIFLDLTCPAWVSDKLTDPDGRDKVLADFKKAVSYFYELLHSRMFPDYSGEFAPMRTPHVWSSDNPLESHLHAHTVFPNVVVDSEEITHPHPAGRGCEPVSVLEISFHRFNPKLDVKLLREVWKEALEKFDLWRGSGLPNLYVQYIRFRREGNYASDRAKKDANRISHKLSYMCRLPIEDLDKEIKTSDLPDANLDWSRYLIDYTTTRANLGFIHNLKRVGFNSHKSVSPRCPLCHSKMTFIRRVGGTLPDIPHLRRSQEGDWIECVPPPDVDVDLAGGCSD